MYIALSVVATMLCYHCQITERNQFILRNLLLVEENISPAGNRTLVTRVTGGYTHHYTTEERLIFKTN